jgi:hypothetical protein
MSAETVTQIITRAVTEPEYRQLLFKRPDEALAGYELSEVEAHALHGLTAEVFEGAVAALEGRISRVQPLGFLVGDGHPDELPTVDQPVGLPMSTVVVQPSGF